MVKAALFSAILVLVALFAWKAVVPGWNEVSTDFANYYVSSRMIYEGEGLDSLYHDRWFKAKGLEYGAPQTQKFAPFPPITAFAALPFAWMEILPAQRVSLIVDLILLVGCVALIQRISGWSWLSSILFLLALGLALSNSVRLGQIYVAVLFVTLLGYWLITWKKEALPGIMYAMVFVIKYFVLIYLPAFWLTGRRKFILVFLASTIALVLFQFAFFGATVMKDFLFTSLLPHLDGRLSGQGIYHYQFQSWESFLSFLFVADPQFNAQPFISFAPAKTPLKYFIILMVLTAMLLVIMKVVRWPESHRLPACLAILGVTGFALLPASATYHFVMLAFPVLLISTLPGLDTRYRWAILILYAGIGFIPYSFFSRLAEQWGVFFGFPRLWAVNLLLITTLLTVLNLDRKLAQP